MSGATALNRVGCVVHRSHAAGATRLRAMGSASLQPAATMSPLKGGPEAPLAVPLTAFDDDPVGQGGWRPLIDQVLRIGWLVACRDLSAA